MLRLTLQTILQAAAHATSTDYARSHLQNVLVCRAGESYGKENLIRIVATDAHILSDVTIEDPELAECIGDRRFLVTPENAAILKLIAKGSKSAPGFPVKIVSPDTERGNDKLSVGFPELAVTIAQETKDNTFPDVDRIKPFYADGSVSIGIDAELLLDLAKALQNGNKKHHIKLTFAAGENAKPNVCPVTVELIDHVGNGAGSRVGVIMPVRL